MRTVLVVDNSLAILSALSEALSDEGWVRVGAVSAAAAMYVAKERKIDVVSATWSWTPAPMGSP